MRSFAKKRKCSERELNISRNKEDEENLDFFEGVESEHDKDGGDESDDSKTNEKNPEEIRLREGKKYLKKLMEMKKKDGEADHEYIESRLINDAMERVGKIPFRKVASLIVDVNVRYLKGHKGSVTCVTIADDGKTLFSGSKDCCIIKWDLVNFKKVSVFKGEKKKESDLVGHKGHVLGLSVSSDGKYLASCGMEKQIYIWDLENGKFLDKFSGHMDFVTGVAFRVGSHDLYSCGMDRSVKVWNCDQMMYVQTMYGHQAPIYGIDALARERCITCSQDKTISIWKVVEQSRVEYRGESSIEVLSLINESNFVSGTQSGDIQLWSNSKRYPIFVHRKAHEIADRSCQLDWISSIVALKYSEIFASGSGNGLIKIWKIEDSFRSFSLLMNVSVLGVVNSLCFSKMGNYLVAAVGKDHRLGRWVVASRDVKNRIAVVELMRG